MRADSVATTTDNAETVNDLDLVTASDAVFVAPIIRIHLIHGIHNDGQSAACLPLVPFLTGTVLVPDYGWIAAVETKRINPVVNGSLQPYIWPDDVLIGHSNGCAVIYDLLQRGVKMRGVVLINGALKNNPTFPEYLKFAHIYSNKGDDITELAELSEAMPFHVVDDNWGDMGHSGYTGTDPRAVNFYCDQMAPTMPVVDGHSDIFTPPKILAWGPFIDQRLQEAYAASALPPSAAVQTAQATQLPPA